MSTLAKLSVAEYEQIVATGVFDGRNKRRIELIWGELRAMNPIGSKHAMMVDRMLAWSIVAAPRDKVWLRVQNLGRLSRLSIVSWSPTSSGPSCVITVRIIWQPTTFSEAHREVADSSLEFDRGEKANLYATAGIREYWIVNIVDRAVEVRRDPYDGRYRSVQSFGPGLIVEPIAISRSRG